MWCATIILATADRCGTAEIIVWTSAGTVHGGTGRGTDARQDVQVRQEATAGRDRAPGRRSGAGAAAAGRSPLDGPDVGEGGGRQLAVGAAHP